MNKRRHAMYLFLSIFLILIFYVGCGNDSNPTNGNSGTPGQVTLPLDNALTNVYLAANQPTQLDLTLQVPPEVGNLNSVEIDIKATMDHLNVTIAKKLSNIKGLIKFLTNQSTASVIYHVGSDPETVCESGIVYGPYEISTQSIDDPDPDNIDLNQGTVDILNNGSIAVCMVITSSVEASFSLDRVEANITEGDCGSPVDFTGSWRGTYKCGNSCDVPFGDSVHITIYNDGSTTHYVDDGGDYYSGKVCGNIYRFEREDPEETERGSLTLISSNFAIKRSTWRQTVFPFCSGDCLDSLYRIVSD